MHTRRLARLSCSAAVFAGLLLASCGTEQAGGDAAAPVGAPNGIEKLSGAEVMQRSRETMADLQSFQRVYTPALPAEAAPGVVARSDLENGCSITYDVGDTGTMDVRVGERGIYMRGDEKSLTRQQGPEAAKRFQGFSLENTKDAPGTTYKKGEPTEIDGIPVLPLEVTEDGKARSETAPTRGRTGPYPKSDPYGPVHPKSDTETGAGSDAGGDPRHYLRNVTVIATESLSKRFPRVTALDRLSMDIGPGVTGLVGANGAGKSTLIKILLGLSPATEGQAAVLGLDVATKGGEIRERVGYMPEHDCLPPDVSATEFVVHMARMSGLPPAAARERTADTLRHVGLYEERYRPIGGYSTGMKQRVKLAQALVHDPDLVFLDEPTNGLDPVGRDEMLGLIRRVHTDFGISVLVTSHLLGELERTCDHVVVIDGGKLLRSSSTSDYTQTMGTLAVEVTDTDTHPDGTKAVREALAARGVTLQTTTEEGLPGAGHILLLEATGEDTYDLVRDTVAELGLGLVRMEQRRHHISEVFKDGPAQARIGEPAEVEAR